MASTSNLVINVEPVTEPRNIIFSNKGSSPCTVRLWCSCPFAIASLVLLIVYLADNTVSCVLYINGIRNVTLKENANCSSVSKPYVNQTDVNQTYVNQTYVNQTYVNQTYVNQTDVNQTDVNQTYVNQTDVNQTDVNQTYYDVNQAYLNQTDVNQTDVNQTYVNQTDVNQTYVNQTDVNQTDVNQTDVNQTDYDLRTEKYFSRSRGVLIALIVCLVIIFFIFFPCIPGNYVICCRRTTCCCRPVSLKDAINRFMFGYISDEVRFQEVVQSGQESLNLIIERLKHFVPEVTFDVLKTGSLVERLGKPTVIRSNSTEHLPIKSVLSTDFDVMLTPQTILASATEEPQISQTLFNVVALQNITPGFLWLKLNKSYQESRILFWRNLCNEFTFADGSKGIYLSSLEVRNVFVKGMKRIKRKETGYFDFFKKMADVGVTFDVKAQGPAVTVKVESREDSFERCIKCCRLPPTLFYGDFIFALRCIGWPQEAREWPTRQRFWPQPAVIQEIMTYGYHVVPKPSYPILDKKKKKKKKKDENQSILEYEWRISFSLAEVLLSRHIPPVARACLLALKATIKRHDYKADEHGWFSRFIQRSKAGGLGISSYHLKTALYWALELNPPDFWCEERIEECFMKLVDTLLDCVKNQHCSHYFMPQVNLMAPSPVPQLWILLSKIKESPASYVSSTSLRCKGNLAACYECMCFCHGEDIYMDVY